MKKKASICISVALWIIWITCIFFMSAGLIYGQGDVACRRVGPNNRTEEVIIPTDRGMSFTMNTGDRRAVEVVAGGIYEFSSCGSTVGTKLAGHQELLPNNFSEQFYANEDNANCPDGGTLQEELRWTSSMTGTLWITLSRYEGGDCTDNHFRPISTVLYIRQYNNVMVSSQPTDQTVNCGGTANFSVRGGLRDGGIGSFNYQWERNRSGEWEEIVAETGESLSIPNVLAEDFGTQYRARVIQGSVFTYSREAVLIDGSADPPSNVMASRSMCNGMIRVTWEWYQSNPRNFLIESSTDRNTWENLVEVSGGVRFYDHEVQRGIPHYYRIRTFSTGCGLYTSASVVVEGLSPLDPAPPVDVVLSKTGDSGRRAVRVNWTDVSNNEEGFFIEKIFDNGNTDRFTHVSEADSMMAVNERRTFLDEEMESCRLYTYRVYAYNVCVPDGIRSSGEEPNVTIKESIVNVVGRNLMEVSKGYYPDRVDIGWSIYPEGNYKYVDRFRLFIRELGTNIVPNMLTTTEFEVQSTEDANAAASTLYEYFLVAEGECGSATIQSFDISTIPDITGRFPKALPEKGVGYSIGFRSPVGVVNGNIAYQGGISVPDVKVVVEREGSPIGRSLELDGMTGYVAIDPGYYLGQISDAFSFSMWFRAKDLSRSDPQVLYDLSDLVILSIERSKLTFSVRNASNSDSFESLESLDEIVEKEWVHVNTTYQAGRLRIYINGELNGEKTVAGMVLSDIYHEQWRYFAELPEEEIEALVNSSQPVGYLYLGGNPYIMNEIAAGRENNAFEGHIDELILFDAELAPKRIQKSYSRYLPHDEPDMIGYWRLNEGAGHNVFDLARSGSVYHGTDGLILNASWSTLVPDQRQLGMAGYSNAYGNYTVAGILYLGNGETFTVTPSD
ncbi:MAG: hypothetical protein OXB93_05020, partial [Cytophagales bacterium]|nr:hypothetical protein [Cytophagales bacterium]